MTPAPGSMAAHDALVAAYRDADGARIAAAARLCGWDGRSPLMGWSMRRCRSYRALMAASERDLARGVAAHNSLTRAAYGALEATR